MHYQSYLALPRALELLLCASQLGVGAVHLRTQRALCASACIVDLCKLLCTRMCRAMSASSSAQRAANLRLQAPLHKKVAKQCLQAPLHKELPTYACKLLCMKK